MEPEDSSVLYNVACLYAKLGETDRAFEALEAALDVGTLHREWIERDPDLDPLRDHPRFAAVMSRVG